MEIKTINLAAVSSWQSHVCFSTRISRSEGLVQVKQCSNGTGAGGRSVPTRSVPARITTFGDAETDGDAEVS